MKKLPDIQEILKLNNIIRTTSEINHLLIVCRDEKDLCKKICSVLVQINGYKLVWLELKENKYSKINSITIEGAKKDFIKIFRNLWHKYSISSNSIDKTLKNGKPFIIRSLKKEKSFVKWNKIAIKKGFLSLAVFPLNLDEDLIGTLHIYSDKENDFSDEEVKFLSEVTTDIIIGITNLRNKKELVASEKRFRDLIYQLPEMIFETNLKGNITFANDSAFACFGYDENDLKGGINILQLISHSEIKKAIHDFKRTLKGENKELNEYTAVRKDKSTLPVLVKANSINNDNGKIIGIRGIAIDLTEQQQMSEKLKMSENIYRTIFDTDIAKIITDDNTKIIMANSEFERLSGFKKEEIENKLSFTKFVHKDEIKKIKNYHHARRLNAGSIPDSYEARFVDRENNVKNVIVKVSIIPSTKKAIESFTDITDRKIMLDNLKESYNKLQNILDGVINLVRFIVEIRDPYTAGHQKRVSELSVAIAKDMSLSEDVIKGLEIAADIHDVGKIYVPIEFLNKSGEINNHEFEIIKSHCKYGYEILKKIEFNQPIADIILQHHERINGSGYPQGLKDKDILIESKIIAVADVIEAISSRRPYRAGFDIKIAIEEIKKNKGILYDSKVVDSCIKLFETKKFAVSNFQKNFSRNTPPPRN